MNFQRREKVVKDPIFTKQRQVDYRYITKKFLKQEVKERLKIKEEERLKIKTIKENKISCNKISYTTEKDAIRAANYVRRK
jgi:hypothetical protein